MKFWLVCIVILTRKATECQEWLLLACVWSLELLFLIVSISFYGDILLQESTYGTHIHEKREERESRFTALVHDIVNRGGRCLIPVFALGRAQELLLILGKYVVLILSIEAVGFLKILISVYKTTFCYNQDVSSK